MNPFPDPTGVPADTSRRDPARVRTLANTEVEAVRMRVPLTGRPFLHHRTAIGGVDAREQHVDVDDGSGDAPELATQAVELGYPLGRRPRPEADAAPVNRAGEIRQRPLVTGQFEPPVHVALVPAHRGDPPVAMPAYNPRMTCRLRHSSITLSSSARMREQGLGRETCPASRAFSDERDGDDCPIGFRFGRTPCRRHHRRDRKTLRAQRVRHFHWLQPWFERMGGSVEP